MARVPSSNWRVEWNDLPCVQRPAKTPARPSRDSSGCAARSPGDKHTTSSHIRRRVVRAIPQRMLVFLLRLVVAAAPHEWRSEVMMRGSIVGRLIPRIRKKHDEVLV